MIKLVGWKESRAGSENAGDMVFFMNIIEYGMIIKIRYI